MPVALTTAPDLADAFRDDPTIHAKLTAMNVSIATICPLMYMTNPLCARAPVATNSNKLRTYSTARFFPDDELVELMCTGSLKQGGKMA